MKGRFEGASVDSGIRFGSLSQVGRGDRGESTGQWNGEALSLDFDRRLMLGLRGSVITSDAGLLAYRELDNVFALTTTGGERLADVVFRPKTDLRSAGRARAI
jgi:hypothetical protein